MRLDPVAAAAAWEVVVVKDRELRMGYPEIVFHRRLRNLLQVNLRPAIAHGLCGVSFALLGLAGFYYVRLYHTGFPAMDLESDAKSLWRIGFPIAIVVGVVLFLARMLITGQYSILTYIRKVLILSVPMLVMTWSLDAVSVEYPFTLVTRAIVSIAVLIVSFLLIVYTAR